ncbi:hypothetical protein D3C81_376360 [compost metagenome]
MSEDAYGKALQEAFDSKTPAEHLADSKYLGRGLTSAAARELFFQQNPRLHEVLSTPGLTVPGLVDALRAYSTARSDATLTFVTYQLVADASASSVVTRPAATQSEVDTGLRLLKRMKKNGNIKCITVHRRGSKAEWDVKLENVPFGISSDLLKL